MLYCCTLQREWPLSFVYKSTIYRVTPFEIGAVRVFRGYARAWMERRTWRPAETFCVLCRDLNAASDGRPDATVLEGEQTSDRATTRSCAAGSFVKTPDIR